MNAYFCSTFNLFVLVFFPTPVFLYKHAFLFHILSSTLTSVIIDIQLQSPTLRVAVLADSDRLTRSLTPGSTPGWVLQKVPNG